MVDLATIHQLPLLTDRRIRYIMDLRKTAQKSVPSGKLNLVQKSLINNPKPLIIGPKRQRVHRLRPAVKNFFFYDLD
jgi:hypothetical protein